MENKDHTIKEDFKGWLKMMGIFFSFAIISAVGLNFLFLGEEDFPLLFLHCALQAITLWGYIFLLQLTDLLRLIVYLVTFPIRLFKRKRGTQAVEKAYINTDGRSVIYFAMLIYGLVGWGMSQFFSGEFWLIAYLGTGLFWGFIVYRAFTHGLIDLEDERAGGE